MILPMEVQPSAEPMDIPAAAREEIDEGCESLQPVGESHYLRTWDVGAVILKRESD